MAESVIYQVVQQTAVIQINRPEARNAINSDVMERLAHALRQAETDPHVHALVLTGTGDRSFVSGGDLKEFHETLQSAEDVYDKWSDMREILFRIAAFPKPVIGAINGAARGGGAELALACHFRVLSENASIGFVQVRLGISPGWGGAALLVRTIGYQKALRLLLTGQIIHAEKAEQIGLADEVVPQEQVYDRALSFASEIAALSPDAVQGILGLMRQGCDLRLEEAMDLESKLCASLWNSDTHQTAIANFLANKRG
jgi:enoyl-CoA hydratase